MNRITSHARTGPRWLAPALAVTVVALIAIALAALRLQAQAATTLAPSGDAPADLMVLLADDVAQPGSVVTFSAGNGTAQHLAKTDLDPAFALTSSGDRIYVASGLDQDGVLTTIDARTGKVIAEVAFTDRWRNTLPAYFDTLSISPDDRWLYALTFEAVGAERDSYSLRVFDVARGQFRTDVVPLGDCIGGITLPGPTGLEVACPHSGVLLTATIGGDGAVGAIASTEISQSGIAGAVRLPASQGTLILTKEGKVVRIDREGVRLLFETEGILPPVFDGLVVSPDGQTINVARGSTSGGMISSIETYDLAGNRLSSMKLADPAWTMSISTDGRRLLLPAHEADAVLVVDARTLETIERLEVPGAPVQAKEP